MNDNTLSNKEVKKMKDNPFKIPREAKAARVIQVIETVTTCRAASSTTNWWRAEQCLIKNL